MGDVPGWVQVVLALAALTTACGVLWTKVLYPLVKGAATAEVMFPLLQDLTIKFRDIPDVFSILKEIVAQVRTDSGSSLLDTVNQLQASLAQVQAMMEKMEVRTLSAAQFLQVGLAADRSLAERDREQLSRMIRELDRIVDRMARIDEDRAAVAVSLAKAQAAVDGVAADLAAAHERADAVDLPPIDGAGAAADAASRSPRQGEP